MSAALCAFKEFMKLSTQEITQLNNIISACVTSGIEAVIIEGGVVRGAAADESCGFISSTNVPLFEGHAVGLTRLSTLRDRISVYGAAEIAVEAIPHSKGFIGSLEVSAAKVRSKVQYRCSSPSFIKAPQSLEDEKAATCKIDAEQLKLLMSADKVMAAERVTFTFKPAGELVFTVRDVNNDEFTIACNSEYIKHTDFAESGVHQYPADILMKLLRTASTTEGVTLTIGQYGTLVVNLFDHDISLFCLVDD